MRHFHQALMLRTLCLITIVIIAAFVAGSPGVYSCAAQGNNLKFKDLDVTIQSNNTILIELNLTNTIGSPVVGIVEATLHNLTGHSTIGSEVQILDSQPVYLPINYTTSMSLETVELTPCSAYSLAIYVLQAGTDAQLSQTYTFQEYLPCSFYTYTWIFAQSPIQGSCYFTCLNVTVTNVANYSVSGTVFAVFRNSLQQPVYVGTGALYLNGTETSWVYVSGPTVPGDYIVDVFGWNSYDAPILPVYSSYLSITSPA